MNEHLSGEIKRAWDEIEAFGPRRVAELWLTPRNKIVDARHRTSPASRAALEIGSYRRGVTLAQLTEDVEFALDQREGLYV